MRTSSCAFLNLWNLKRTFRAGEIRAFALASCVSRDRARLCQPCAVQTSSTCSTYDLLVAKARAPFAAHATPDARRAVDEVTRNAPKSEMRQEPSTLSPSRPQETLALVLYRLHVLPDELQQVIQSCVRFTPAYSTAVLELYWRDKKTCIHRHGDMHTWDVSRLNLEDVPSYRYSELHIPGVTASEAFT